jgi:hypothetical protein
MSAVAKVAEKYAAMAQNFANSESDRIVRPDPNTYELFLTGGNVKEDDVTFYESDGLVIEGIAISAQWLLPEGDGEGEAEMSFPGRYWVVPLATNEEISQLPKNQKQRVDIFWPQFKSFVTGLLGYDPGAEFVEALKGCFQAANESHDKGEGMKFNVLIKNRKKDPDNFDREVILKQIV